jgi:hypothetical protein
MNWNGGVNCDHSRDAGVICERKIYTDILFQIKSDLYLLIKDIYVSFKVNNI